MAERAEDGASRRAHLEKAAARGNAEAIAALDGPPCPEAVAYLRDWALALYGRSGADMSGVAPLSYQTIDAWARLTDEHPTPDDVRALILLDQAFRHPDEPEAVAADEPPTPMPEAAWPVKRTPDPHG